MTLQTQQSPQMTVQLNTSLKLYTGMCCSRVDEFRKLVVHITAFRNYMSICMMHVEFESQFSVKMFIEIQQVMSYLVDLFSYVFIDCHISVI